MARKSKGRKSTGRRSRAQRIEDNRFISPTIDWSSGVPEQFKMPSIAELKGMSLKGLQDELVRFGAFQPMSQGIAENIGYLQRMTDIPPGTPEFDTALRTLTNSAEKRGALSQARRTYRSFGFADALAKNPNQEFVRLSETDDHTCDSCWDKAGFVGTMREQAERGLPGAASCYGSDYCRCSLILLD